jgi:hypothetical protein
MDKTLFGPNFGRLLEGVGRFSHKNIWSPCLPGMRDYTNDLAKNKHPFSSSETNWTLFKAFFFSTKN